MRKIELSYSWTGSGASRLIRNALMDLLHAVQDAGSISAAAKALDLS
ncbi:MAG TPA: LysR family transcriptional regulator, partial [Ramlibacter sp.]|nr:LysR family transcriptional regulator [Ramlibacter sp.]